MRRGERCHSGVAERGQGMVEYGLVIGLIAILVIGVFAVFGGRMAGRTGLIQRSLGGEGTGEREATLSAAIYG